MVRGRYRAALRMDGQYVSPKTLHQCSASCTVGFSTMIQRSSYANPLARLVTDASSARPMTPSAGAWYERGSAPSGTSRLMRRSPAQVELHDVPDRGHPVLPADLLALGVRAARVGNRHFEDSRAGLRQAGRDLGLEAEPIRRQAERSRQIPADGLVARLHVREVEIREHVAEHGEHAVTD